MCHRSGVAIKIPVSDNYNSSQILNIYALHISDSSGPEYSIIKSWILELFILNSEDVFLFKRCLNVVYAAFGSKLRERCIIILKYSAYWLLWIIAYKGGVWVTQDVNESPCNICRDALHTQAIKRRWWKASLLADINCCYHQMPILPPGR